MNFINMIGLVLREALDRLRVEHVSCSCIICFIAVVSSVINAINGNQLPDLELGNEFLEPGTNHYTMKQCII